MIAGAPTMVITVTFTDEHGKTRMTSHVQFASAKDLQDALAMGMAEGLAETWDRLEQYLGEIK